MKTLLAFLLLALTAFAEDALPPAWRGDLNVQTVRICFTSAENPSQGVTLNVGPFATGFRTSILARSNVWDLGKGGTVTLTIPPCVRARVQATYWFDGWLYNSPFLNGSLPLASASVQPFAMGAWYD